MKQRRLMMAARRLFGGCRLGLALAVLGYAVLGASASAGAGEIRIYTSARYGYSLHYPAACGLKAEAQGAYVDLTYQGRRLSTITVEQLDETGKAERRGSPDLWKEFMVERAKLSCDADGPDGTVYCQRVEQENTWETARGLRVIELYLRKVQVDYGPPQKSTSSAVGPIYAVDISRKGYVFGLLVGSGHDYPHTPIEKEVVKKIVSSVSLIPESEFHPPKPHIATPGPLFEGRPGRVLILRPSK
jgi:hypothetical protein